MHQGNLKEKNSKPEKGRKLPKRITESYLHNAGLHYLERFACSSAHFRRVMMRKIDRSCTAHKDQDREQCITLLENLIAKFQRAGLLNDAAYTRGMIESLRRRGLSARAIHARLQTKGLSREAIEAAITAHKENNDDEDAEMTAAMKLARRKKIGPFASRPQDDAQMKKSLAAFARAGFSYETASRVLGMKDTGEY